MEHRISKVSAIPADNPLAESFVFHYRGTPFSLIKTSKATFEADFRIVDTTNPNAVRYCWKLLCWSHSFSLTYNVEKEV